MNLELIQSYKKVIDAWKKRADIMTGEGLGWKPKGGKLILENIPFGFGVGTGNTGWCVSSSESLLKDPYFVEFTHYRGAKAKLISIDIKEQYYGECYNGNQNKWHTAILVEDGGVLIVIDVTCRQFGNKFIEKDIWDFGTWQETLRSPNCKHHITDFVDNELAYAPKLNTLRNFNKDYLYSSVMSGLYNITTITNEERSELADYLVNQRVFINNKLLTKTLTVEDLLYIKKINKLLGHLPKETYNKTYAVFEFINKESAKNWLKSFIDNDCKINMNILTSPNIESSCIINGIDYEKLNMKTKNIEKFFVVFEFNNYFGVETKEFFKHTELYIPVETYLNVRTIVNGLFKGHYDKMREEGMENEEIEKVLEDLTENEDYKQKLNTTYIIID